MLSKRYQVFVSSTYADLKEERSKVIQTIMELDCIPAGMEIFPAIDEDQLNFIKRIIDDCDYYILIIGGRYGSISEDGISYTEKEYNYAIEKKIKVLAFIHSDPDSIPLGKSEKDEKLREKLEGFKKTVSKGRLVKYWRTAEDLPGLVALSLSKTIKIYPAMGWIRANLATNVQVLDELNEQRKENQELKKALEEFERSQVVEVNLENLAGLDDTIKINGEYFYGGTQTWEIQIKWGEIFYLLSPFLLELPHDLKVKTYLSEAIFNLTKLNGNNPKIDEVIFQTIKIHLNFIQLIKITYSKTTKGGMGLFWGLTKKGRDLMLDLRSVKKGK